MREPVTDEEKTIKARPTWVRAVGLAAGIVSSLAFSQQVYKLYTAGKPSSLTWVTLGACILGQMLWIVYGFGTSDMIVLGVAVVTVTIYLLLAFTKVKYKN